MKPYLGSRKLEDGDRLSVALELIAARQAEETRPPAVCDVQRVPLSSLHKPAKARALTSFEGNRTSPQPLYETRDPAPCLLHFVQHRDGTAP